VDHSGANRRYYLSVLSYIQNNPRCGISVSQSSLGEFIDKGVPDGTDVLSYQTFPSQYNTKKFNWASINKADTIFHGFIGKKLLVDCHDSGDVDAYERMVSGIVLPRIKCFPSHRLLKNDNVNIVLCSTVSAAPGVFQDKYNRIIPISCKFGEHPNGFYGHPIRDIVRTYLRESFYNLTNFDWVIGKQQYFNELRWTNIVVGAPGWGEYNTSYWMALKSGALLFAHRTLNDIKLFPHSDLIDGEDYVSYDLYNFKRKLQRLLDNPDEIERIRNNGRMKCLAGLNYEKSADQLVNYLKGEIK
jgi:hypothetical protein